ncbi:MAG: dipeptidase PepE [Planctomycetes bacterium]|nr:dipeptidase PepE [Planctomycetota bacterium]
MRNLVLNSSSALHGYGYMDHCETAVRDLFDGCCVVFVPWALHDLDAYTSTVGARFEKMGIELVGVHTFDDPVVAVNEADGVFVGGGNTFRLLTRLHDSGISGAIRERVGKGMPYMGSSAGTNVACPTIMTTNDMPIVQPPTFEALDLVPFQINPHYQDPDPGSTHKGETREDRIREYHEMNTHPVVGLREGGWLRVRGDEIRLEGLSGARIFRRDAEPEEAEPGAELVL